MLKVLCFIDDLKQEIKNEKEENFVLFEKKLEEPMCDDYGDYDDDSYEGSVSEGSHWDNGFNAGYEAAKQDLVKLAQKRDAQGRFVK